MFIGDTLLVCANGHLTDNKLAVGLLFPCLLTSDIFALPIENVLLVPDYTMEEIGREFEKLIIGGNCKISQPDSEQNEQVELVDLEEDNTKEEYLDHQNRESSQDDNQFENFSPTEETELIIDETVADVVNDSLNEVRHSNAALIF